jgi:hypothetical protein
MRAAAETGYDMLAQRGLTPKRLLRQAARPPHLRPSGRAVSRRLGRGAGHRNYADGPKRWAIRGPSPAGVVAKIHVLGGPRTRLLGDRQATPWCRFKTSMAGCGVTSPALLAKRCSSAARERPSRRDPGRHDRRAIDRGDREHLGRGPPRLSAKMEATPRGTVVPTPEILAAFQELQLTDSLRSDIFETGVATILRDVINPS